MLLDISGQGEIRAKGEAADRAVTLVTPQRMKRAGTISTRQTGKERARNPCVPKAIRTAKTANA
jgi:hypothetical protein